MKAKVNKFIVEITQGNIYTLDVDAVVSVTDPNLTASPVLLALAGEAVQGELKRIGWCDVGKAVLTDPGNLKNIRKIIHTVGPRWGEGSERGKLQNATWESLSLAEAHELKSIALPAISVGTLGYPVENCAKTMLTRVIDYTFEPTKHLRQIIVCLADEAEYTVFRAEFEQQIEDLRQSGEGKVRIQAPSP